LKLGFTILSASKPVCLVAARGIAFELGLMPACRFDGDLPQCADATQRMALDEVIDRLMFYNYR